MTKAKQATQRDTYERLRWALDRALTDLSILAGDEASAGASWQDVAGTAAANLRLYAAMLDSLRTGEPAFGGVPWRGATVFPSPDGGRPGEDAYGEAS